MPSGGKVPDNIDSVVAVPFQIADGDSTDRIQISLTDPNSVNTRETRQNSRFVDADFKKSDLFPYFRISDPKHPDSEHCWIENVRFESEPYREEDNGKIEVNQRLTLEHIQQHSNTDTQPKSKNIRFHSHADFNVLEPSSIFVTEEPTEYTLYRYRDVDCTVGTLDNGGYIIRFVDKTDPEDLKTKSFHASHTAQGHLYRAKFDDGTTQLPAWPSSLPAGHSSVPSRGSRGGGWSKFWRDPLDGTRGITFAKTGPAEPGSNEGH